MFSLSLSLSLKGTPTGRLKFYARKKRDKPSKQQEPDWQSELVVQFSGDKESMLGRAAIEMTSKSTFSIGDIIAD